MSDLLERRTIGESRHQFIYGKANSDRLKQFELNNPVFVNRDLPMAVYIDNSDFPQVIKSAEIDIIIAQRMAIEYLNFAIASRILDNIIMSVDSTLLKNTEGKFIERINRLFINNDNCQISNIEELLDVVNSMRGFYKKAYIEYLATGKSIDNILELPIAFLQIDWFCSHVKRLLNSSGYFALVFDIKKQMPVLFQQVINNLISSRINQDISVKVFCEDTMWTCYYDTNGQIIEDVHDYGSSYYDNEGLGYSRSRSVD